MLLCCILSTIPQISCASCLSKYCAPVWENIILKICAFFSWRKYININKLVWLSHAVCSSSQQFLLPFNVLTTSKNLYINILGCFKWRGGLFFRLFFKILLAYFMLADIQLHFLQSENIWNFRQETNWRRDKLRRKTPTRIHSDVLRNVTGKRSGLCFHAVHCCHVALAHITLTDWIQVTYWFHVSCLWMVLLAPLDSL